MPIDMEPQAQTLDIGGGTAVANLWRAQDDGAAAALILPALGTPARVYQRLARALQAQGLHALSIDFRGQGDSSVRAAREHDWGYLDLVDGETARLVAYARSQLPDAPLHLVCHSLGGHAALMYLARHPAHGVASVALVASG